jgi:hypothetical protein
MMKVERKRLRPVVALSAGRGQASPRAARQAVVARTRQHERGRPGAACLRPGNDQPSRSCGQQRVVVVFFARAIFQAVGISRSTGKQHRTARVITELLRKTAQVAHQALEDLTLARRAGRLALGGGRARLADIVVLLCVSEGKPPGVSTCHRDSRPPMDD